ncbi:MAG: KamA family radical SAM protein [Candidatus Eisenbacteria bacterium]|nr:KamA family radical SAM protein [Candidatus Eisenbacteria bacterium]
MPRRQEWQRELARVVTTGAELSQIIRLTEGEKKAIDSLEGVYRLMVSRHYLSLIDPSDPDDPLRRTVVPLLDELKHRPGEKDDDVHADEARYQPVPGIVHRYPGKLLLIPTLSCPSHCRFCFRKGRKVMHLSHDQGERALDYIRRDQSIRDVVITGGEPLILSDEELHYWVSSVRAIRHVQIVRITTRFPIYIPSRITPDLVRMLAEHRPLYLTFSFVHPREITPELEQGISMLADAGIVLLQQGPILRGVNDDPETLRRLYERLAALRVLPYYAIWGIRAPGAEHFMIGGERAAELIGALENKTSGFCVPHLITIARGDKVRMMGWSPEKEAVHLMNRERTPSAVPSSAADEPRRS